MMKSIEIGALSLVIAVWWGISRYSSRRSTQTGLSMTGVRITTPRPFRANVPTPPHTHPLKADVRSRAEPHQPLVLAHDPEGLRDEQDDEQQHDADCDPQSEHDR